MWMQIIASFSPPGQNNRKCGSRFFWQELSVRYDVNLHFKRLNLQKVREKTFLGLRWDQLVMAKRKFYKPNLKQSLFWYNRENVIPTGTMQGIQPLNL